MKLISLGKTLDFPPIFDILQDILRLWIKPKSNNTPALLPKGSALPKRKA